MRVALTPRVAAAVTAHRAFRLYSDLTRRLFPEEAATATKRSRNYIWVQAEDLPAPAHKHGAGMEALGAGLSASLRNGFAEAV